MTQQHLSSGSSHPLAIAYLAELRQALRPLPPLTAEEIVADISEHIDIALSDQEIDAASVNAVLRGLGPVDAIASEASPASPPAASPVAPHPETGGTPLAAAPPASAAAELPGTGGAAITGAALGIASIVLALIFPLAIPLAVAALVLGITGLRRDQQRHRGAKLTAVITGGVGLLFAAIAALAAAGLLATFQGPANETETGVVSVGHAAG